MISSLIASYCTRRCRCLQPAAAPQQEARGLKRPAPEQASPAGAAKQLKCSAAAVPATPVSAAAAVDRDMAPQAQAKARSTSASAQADPEQPPASKAAQRGHLLTAKPLTPSGAALADAQSDLQPSPAADAHAGLSPAAGSKALEQLGRLLRSGSATPLSCLKGQAVADVAGEPIARLCMAGQQLKSSASMVPLPCRR